LNLFCDINQCSAYYDYNQKIKILHGKGSIYLIKSTVIVKYH